MRSASIFIYYITLSRIIAKNLAKWKNENLL